MIMAKDGDGCKFNRYGIFANWEVDGWNVISVFNLSTLELDNGSQILFFAESFEGILQSCGCWLSASFKIGCKLGATLKCIKKKNPVSRWPTGLFLWRFRMGLNQRPPWLTVPKARFLVFLYDSENVDFQRIGDFCDFWWYALKWI